MNPEPRILVKSGDLNKNQAQSTTFKGKNAEPKVEPPIVVSGHAIARGDEDVLAELKTTKRPMVLNGENKGELHKIVRALEDVIQSQRELLEDRRNGLKTSVHDFKTALTLIECGLSAAISDPEHITSNLKIVKRGAIILNQQASNMLLDETDIELTQRLLISVSL